MKLRLGLLLLTSVCVWAKVAPASIENMTLESDLIVVAEVTQITLPLPDRYAEATISSVWKGPPGLKKVLFRASASWACDTSDAVLHEQTVLFLNPEKGNLYRIVHAGRGRMPLRKVRNELYATVWSDVWLGDGVATIPGPDPRYDFIRSVRLNTLRRLVQKP